MPDGGRKTIMLPKKHLRQQSGFSLTELMIVVGIIGILATLALPRFKEFQAKARMSEAKVILNGIYALQESYHLDTNQYIGFALHGRDPNSGEVVCPNDPDADRIGFYIDPCVAGAASPTPRYGYTAQAAGGGYEATAATGAGENNLVCPGKDAHEFTMDNNRVFDGPTACGS